MKSKTNQTFKTVAASDQSKTINKEIKYSFLLIFKVKHFWAKIFHFFTIVGGLSKNIEKKSLSKFCYVILGKKLNYGANLCIHVVHDVCCYGCLCGT